VLGNFSLPKLIFLGFPKLIDSSPLWLDGVISVHDDLSGLLALPKVSLLSNGLFDDGYGTTLDTLSIRFCKNRARDAFRA
jgi:hypothetical protein